MFLKKRKKKNATDFIFIVEIINHMIEITEIQPTPHIQNYPCSLQFIHLLSRLDDVAVLISQNGNV